MPVQAGACQSNKSNLAVTTTANKMDANNKTIDSKSTGSEEYTSIDVRYINQTHGSYLITPALKGSRLSTVIVINLLCISLLMKQALVRMKSRCPEEVVP